MNKRVIIMLLLGCIPIGAGWGIIGQWLGLSSTYIFCGAFLTGMFWGIAYMVYDFAH